jgi:hypothetical protein
MFQEIRSGCIIPDLAVWPISGNITQTRDFEMKLQNSCWLLEGKSQPNHMIHCAKDGSAGVLNGARILF